jgi:hypothetical protein
LLLNSRPTVFGGDKSHGVACEPPTSAKPCESALHDPAPAGRRSSVRCAAELKHPLRARMLQLSRLGHHTKRGSPRLTAKLQLFRLTQMKRSSRNRNHTSKSLAYLRADCGNPGSIPGCGLDLAKKQSVIICKRSNGNHRLIVDEKYQSNAGPNLILHPAWQGSQYCRRVCRKQGFHQPAKCFDFIDERPHDKRDRFFFR